MSEENVDRDFIVCVFLYCINWLVFVWETYCMFSLRMELSFVCNLNGLQFLFSNSNTNAEKFSPTIVITQLLCAEYPKRPFHSRFLFSQSSTRSPTYYVPYRKGDRTLRGFKSSEPLTFLFSWMNVVSATIHHCSAYSSVSSVSLSSEGFTAWHNCFSLINLPIFYDTGVAVLFP